MWEKRCICLGLSRIGGEASPRTERPLAVPEIEFGGAIEPWLLSLPAE